MANLSSLVHELRERIAASSSTPPTKQNDEALEARFRAVLPNLLHAYVVPSPSAKEREVMAVLKLLTHTAKSFPGVFYHGKAAAVLPIIGRIVPFFAEPAFRSRHGVLFETIGSLLSLLRTGDRDAYRNFFVDIMLLVEDLLYVCSLYGESCSTELEKVCLKCFNVSFAGACGEDALLSHVPASSKPADGYGILIDLTGKERWQPFATSAVKLLSKCLTEGTLYVEGLVYTPCVLAACSLICYGDDNLHIACFDFIRLIGAVMDFDIIPFEKLIQSMAIILGEDEYGLSTFRGTAYDSSLAACLCALYTSCPDDIVKSTASTFIKIFPESFLKTKSQELKAALCSAYVRIAKSCPPHIWRPENLIYLLRSDKSVFLLIDCFQVAISRLRLDFWGGGLANDCSVSSSGDNENKNLRTTEKRPAMDSEYTDSKRQKIVDEREDFITNCKGVHDVANKLITAGEREYADYMHSLLSLFVEDLAPPFEKASSLNPEVELAALIALCVVFCEYPQLNISLSIFRQFYKWIPWIAEQENKELPSPVDLSFFLEAVNIMLLTQGSLPSDGKLFKCQTDWTDFIGSMLKLPWIYSLERSEPHPSWKAKCLSVQVLSKIDLSKIGNNLDILDLSLHDQAEEVRLEAVISMPVIVLWSGYGFLTHMFKRLEILLLESNDKIKKAIPLSLGFLACLYGSCHGLGTWWESECKLYLNKQNRREKSTTHHLLRGFRCSKCDSRVVVNQDFCSTAVHPPGSSSMEHVIGCDYTCLQSLFFQLLYDESSEEVQVACIGILGRVLLHGTGDILQSTRSEWMNCVDFLLLHQKKAIREAFCTQISFFFEEPILNCLVLDMDLINKTKEQKFMDKIKHALAAADDPLMFETLLEAAANILISVNIKSQPFLMSLTLLIDQLDNPHVTVRITASTLIKSSCHFHFKGGLCTILSKVLHIRNELYDYLSTRLASRPEMIEEFAVAVLGIETEELVKRMIPVVLPKLVVFQHHNDQAIIILHEMAKCLKTDMVQLIVNWLPKVLAFSLNRADEQELLSTLQYYHDQTGSDNKEIFAAALPALLDELVCFIDEKDPEEVCKRLTQVPQTIKEVARTLTGDEDLPGFLRNHFVGLLNSIDRKMLHTEDVLLQKQAIKRIEMLINMMDTHLSTYVPKLMVLLMHAIRKEHLVGEGLAVLHVFIKQLVKISPSSTKHIISQVFAALVPFLERDKVNSSLHLNKIVEILEELMLQNKFLLKQHIHEFPPLPKIPALAELNKVIQEAQSPRSLKEQLLDVANGLNHENLNVRYMVASELGKLLNQRREEVTVLAIKEGNQNMDVLSSLFSSLLRGCAEESRTSVGQRLKLICADCLGAIGAVDPAKFVSSSSTRFKIACSDDDLIFELIHKHLARAFRAAPDTIIQDSAALAIQELLKIAGCEASLDENVAASTSERKNKPPRKAPASAIKTENHGTEICGRGQKLWDRFSDYVKEIIAPCLTSRFQLPDVSDSASSGPIYHPSMSFRRWIFFWIKKLTVHAVGSRASVFNACRGIVRHDMQIAMYLLPYLVLNAVCHGNEEARHGITQEILSVLDVAASDHGSVTVHGINPGQSEVCIQAVFTLLDNLGQWVDDIEQELALFQSLQPSNCKQQGPKSKENNMHLVKDSEVLTQCNHVSDLLAAIPKVTLARASFRCQASARSLLYFECHVRERSGSFNPAAEKSGFFEDDDVSFLMEIYSNLDEPDGLSGLACLRKSKNLQDHLLINKKAGNWAEVLTSCEQALQMEPTSVQRHSDVLNCLLNMCHLQAMVTHVDGLISRIPQYKKMWCMQGVQAAWRLGRWDLMDEYLTGADEEGLLCSSSESNASFDMDVAKILQAIMKKDQFLVAEKIASSKQALIAPLAAAGWDSYARAYPFVVKLHLLRELEDFNMLLAGDSFLDKQLYLSEPDFCKIIANWENRLKFTQPSLWAREPLLAFRRLVFGASGLGAQVGNFWVQYAKLCRLAGHYETANRAILEAKASGAPNVHMEKAKLLWSTRRADGAIAELQQSLLNMPEILGSAAMSSITSLSLVPLNPQPLLCDTQSLNENRDIARTLLLYSRWIHYTGQKQKEDVISLYSRVKELQPKWEKGYFYMAKYCDEVLVDARKRQENSFELPRVVPSNSVLSSAASNSERRWWSYLPDVLLFYARGLHKGHKNLFQALPRLLTLWFEFGCIYGSDSASNKDMKSVHAKVTSIMRGCLKDLPTYQWLAVLPQLVSRICHQNEEIVRLVKHIITSVLRQYPQQALWTMAAVTKSAVPSRRSAAEEIIDAARRGSSQGGTRSLFMQFATLIDHLIRLCLHPGQAKAKTINISTEFSALKRMMPVDIIMPIQQSLAVNLPSCEMNVTSPSTSDIFSFTDLPTISGIADEAEILSSLQRPKKVFLFGSDGTKRPFLCKPKDDLRKDARMMEFNAMINRLLSKCPESRRRKLYIRTFAVTPLTEDCGMVEWVSHTRGLRPILQDIYISCRKFDRQKTNPQIKRIYDQCQGKMPEEEMLKNKILPMFPPAFHRWFLNTFSEPAAWFRARVAYAHTTAVWSMVGHIVGLGDRHGENILFDSTTGDCIHVDFSCLFDKGLQLEKPELVPFRLTQNIIDGLGITGYEGIFLRVCEITLSVLRAHRETLMNVLETFIHDPLVEWTKSHKSSGIEVQNPHAQRAISNIEARLQGVVVGVGAAPSLPLAVEGQARRLIAEAVSHKNLGKMYIWWMPWF
ncbi:unnamed protein product [Coffea canephora]|uniref:Serine/threonine-protein kinase ATR n=1 Tax=Coffea canephora TaxID=49390 RepID=A0A068V3R9_COFCA|nr:unnamed protein product [Coffea canephora]